MESWRSVTINEERGDDGKAREGVGLCYRRCQDRGSLERDKKKGIVRGFAILEEEGGIAI